MPKLQRTGVQPLGQAGMATNVVRVKVVEFVVHGTQNLVFRLVLLEFILRTENGPPKISVHFPIFFSMGVNIPPVGLSNRDKDQCLSEVVKASLVILVTWCGSKSELCSIVKVKQSIAALEQNSCAVL